MKVFEKIFNQSFTEVIGTKELDPNTLVKRYYPSAQDFVWIQYENDPTFKRVLLDSQISVSR